MSSPTDGASPGAVALVHTVLDVLQLESIQVPPSGREDAALTTGHALLSPQQR
jgi:hypothetical protein